MSVGLMWSLSLIPHAPTFERYIARLIRSEMDNKKDMCYNANAWSSSLNAVVASIITSLLERYGKTFTSNARVRFNF